MAPPERSPWRESTYLCQARPEALHGLSLSASLRGGGCAGTEVFTVFLAARCQVHSAVPEGISSNSRGNPVQLPSGCRGAQPRRTPVDSQSCLLSACGTLGRRRGRRLPTSLPLRVPQGRITRVRLIYQLDGVLWRVSWEAAVFIHCTVCPCPAQLTEVSQAADG